MTIMNLPSSLEIAEKFVFKLVFNLDSLYKANEAGARKLFSHKKACNKPLVN